MENQQKIQPTKMANVRKTWNMSGLVIVIIAACFVIGLMLFGDTSSSRASTPSEIAAQEEFQRKLITTQEEFQQKTDVAAEADQTRGAAERSKAKSDSTLKKAEK